MKISLTIPLVPPSVNHYKMRTRKGVTFVSTAAKSFKQAVGIMARQARLPRIPKGSKLRYVVEIWVYLGKGKRGDGDNFEKCIFDGLTEAGVIHSDAAVKDHTTHVCRDWVRPRTEIAIEVLG